jgi:hypothetical protein
VIRLRTPNSALGAVMLTVALAVPAFLCPGASTAQARSMSRSPAVALARLTDLGFSPREAKRLLVNTQTHPGTPAGAYAAQRIAMAVLYGTADAFGGPRYHPAGR